MFLQTVRERATVPSLSNPTQMVRQGNRIFYLEGFNLGQNNGRLMSVTVTSGAGGTTFSAPVQITATGTSPETANLDSPFGLATDGTNLFISVGFGIATDGAILKVSNLSGNIARFERINLDTSPGAVPLNPAFLLVTNVDGNQYCYWSEYSALANGGRVRRVRTDAVGPVQTVVNQLNFPAGLATDGTNLVICDSQGGADGQVVRVPLAFTSTLTPSSPSAAIITPVTGQQAIRRPFDIAYDGITITGGSATPDFGFVFSEGNAIETPGTVVGPAPTGVGNGAVRYLPSNSTTARIISNGLTNVAGLSVAGLVVTNNSYWSSLGVVFTESVPINGRVLRRVINTRDTFAPATPTPVAIGLNRPLSGMVFRSGLGVDDFPEFLVLVNYAGGLSNGLLNSYRP